MPEPEIFGRYEMIRRIALGGMSEVWLAKMHGVSGFERQVAIKRILPQFSKRPEFVHGFLNEAKFSTQLTHPNIGQIYELGVWNGHYFLAMEYVNGFDLGAILKAPLPLPVALRIAFDLLQGLHFAHDIADEAGSPLHLVHRDITPSNILVSKEGVTKVVDFGIAKATASIDDRRTATGALKGKCAYMAPEQVAGAGALDRRVDVFAAGIVLYEMFAGKNPFRGESDYITIDNIVKRPAPALGAPVPVALAAVVQRCLAKDPGERYQTVAALSDDLEAAARALRLTPRHAAVAEYLATHRDAFRRVAEARDELTATQISIRRPRRTAPMLAAGVLGAALILCAVLFFRRDEARIEPVAPAPAPAPVVFSPPSEVPPLPPPLAQHPPAKRERKIESGVEAGTGRLRIIVSPWAQVWIDGKPMGDTPFPPVELSAGVHDVRFENPDLKHSRERRVNISAGELVVLRETLLRDP